jgi:Family of unknown function (DUF5681)
MSRNNGRNTDGTFAKGNPGKRKGTLHRVTRAVADLIEGEAEAITRKAVEAALEGDTTALRLCLERICPPPKDTPVSFELSEMKTAKDAAEAMSSVLGAVAIGDVTPIEANRIAGIIEIYRKALETSELEGRLQALEKISDQGAS